MVMVDEEAHSLLVVVPNDQLSLAIGRQGQNVRLASKLLGWRIDVKSEQRYSNLEDPGYRAILAIDGVDESLADLIFAKGITTVQALAGSSVADLVAIRSIDDEFASYLIKAAQAITGETPESLPAKEAVQEDVPAVVPDTSESDVQEHEELSDAGDGEANQE
jgi:N utilization substance protein A